MSSFDLLQVEIDQLKGLLVRSLSKSFRLPHDLPLSLQNDRKFISSLVMSNAIESYGQLPEQWKHDEDIICSLFEKDWDLPRHDLDTREHNYASFYCQDAARRNLWNELPFKMKVNEKVTLYALRSKYGPAWRKIHVKFRSNKEIMGVALQYGKLKFEDIPDDHLKRNDKTIAAYGVVRQFLRTEDCPCLDASILRDLLQENKIKWEELPSFLVDNVGFASTIVDFSKNYELPRWILDRFVEMREEHSFWQKVLQSAKIWEEKKRSTLLGELLNEFAPRLLSDHAFLLQACSINTKLFCSIHGRLANDSTFLDEILEQNPLVVQYLSREGHDQHRDLVLKTLPRIKPYLQCKCKRDEYEHSDIPFEFYCLANDLSDNINPDVWLRDFEFVLTWIRSGLGFPHDSGIRRAYYSIPAICLEDTLATQSLGNAGWFRADVTFISMVVDRHPKLYLAAKGEARKDPMIMSTVFAACPEIAGDVMEQLHFEGRDVEIQTYLAFLRRQLELFEKFQTFVLGKMLSTQSVEDTGTAVTLLNQGTETSLMYKQKIAGYLGIPTGKQLYRFQQAERNVLEAISTWTEGDTDVQMREAQVGYL